MTERVAAVILSEQLGAMDILGVVIITFGILAVQIARQTGGTETNSTAK